MFDAAEHRRMSTSTALHSTPGTPDASRSARERGGQWLMVGGGLLLGTLGVFLEEAGQSPLTAVWFRCAFGGLALSVWFSASRRWGEVRLARRDGLLAVAAGLSMVTSWVLFFEAITRTSMAVATLVVHVQPFLVMAFGAWWLRERVSRRQGWAAVAALLGLGLATGWLDGALGAVSHSPQYLAGIALALGAALAYAAAPLMVRSARGATPLALAWWQCAAGSVVLLWWPLIQGWPAPGPAWGWLAGMGVVHTGLAYVLLYAGVARLPAARMAVLQFVYPASAIAVDALVYGRVLSASQMVGVVVMLAALMVVGLERARSSG